MLRGSPGETLFGILFVYLLTWKTGTSTNGDNESKRESCHYDLVVAWTSEISNSLVAATPLVADINADKILDIISPAFTEEVVVLDGVRGQNLVGSNWPASSLDNSFHASPLPYDIDQDGRDDIVLCTSDGDILFIDARGNWMKERTMSIPSLDVRKEWWNLTGGSRQDVIGQSVRTSTQRQAAHSRDSSSKQYISVDPHVLATPVIADLNRDGITEELVVPVSYYINSKIDRSEIELMESGVPDLDLRGYLAGGIVLFNLTAGQIYQEVILELTMRDDEFPGYILFTPTVVDLDSEGGPLEIIVGTSAGNLHVLDHTGTPRTGFPLLLSTLHGQITVEDLDGDGHLEMVVMDTSSNVMCLDVTGKELWDSQISGSSSAGSRVADINRDGSLDIVIATNDGHIWVLRGDTGKLVAGWPLDLGGRFLASPVITRLKPSPHPLDIVIADYEGSLYIISGDGACLEVIHLEENIMTPVLAADLLPTTSDLELLIASSDGTLVCLKMRNGTESREGSESGKNKRAWSGEAWHTDTPTYNKFTNWDNEVGVSFTAKTKQLEYVAGKTFVIAFEIFDNRPKYISDSTYHVHITCGNIILLPKTILLEPGIHRMRIATPDRPIRAVVTVHVTNQHGQLFRDSFAVSFNLQLVQELQWLLFAPFVVMVILLLLVHGYPEVDLLPMTQSFKHR
ncbi:protein DEFECTIVE IN EXINE FORMATION 1-like [Acanthaster planci]|uniref:Protein DEFECTIVE IN EXINE FORMATION 1-like n=1 Tax=Acanthaster planci TaxID=133434 RepID=A0A8B7ZFB4_ACAPL|nr:protein DEFECTIVE IN EXINE FORMATION 1-like [Acanthaster planci]